MSLGISHDDIVEAIYIAVSPATWERRFVRPCKNYLLQANEMNASMAVLGDRVLDEIECVGGVAPSSVAHVIVHEREQVKLGFAKQDSDEYYTAEVDLLDFKCALLEMSKQSGLNPIQLVQQMRRCGADGKLQNRETLSRHFLLLAAFGTEINE